MRDDNPVVLLVINVEYFHSKSVFFSNVYLTEETTSSILNMQRYVSKAKHRLANFLHAAFSSLISQNKL